jgi:hypothetical protein
MIFVSNIDLHSDIKRQRTALATDINDLDDLVADIDIGVVEDVSDTTKCDSRNVDECSQPR